MTIRPATSADADRIADFNIALAHDTENITLHPPTVRDGVRAVLEDPAKGFYFVAEIDGQVVGQVMVTYEWSDWRNGNIWWLQSVFVAAPYRGRGVFKSLFAHVLAESRKRPEVCGLRLYMENHNHTARKVYQTLGMRQSNYVVFESQMGNAAPQQRGVRE